MTESLREQIARIIDPSSWEVLDGHRIEVDGLVAWQDPSVFEDKTSLAKADEILALIIPSDLREASELAMHGRFTCSREECGFITIRAEPGRIHVADAVYGRDGRLIALAVNRIRELLATAD